MRAKPRCRRMSSISRSGKYASIALPTAEQCAGPACRFRSHAHAAARVPLCRHIKPRRHPAHTGEQSLRSRIALAPDAVALIPNVEARNRDRAEFEESQPQAIPPAVRLALHHTVAFQNHQQAVSRALMQLELRCQFHQAEVALCPASASASIIARHDPAPGPDKEKAPSHDLTQRIILWEFKAEINDAAGTLFLRRDSQQERSESGRKEQHQRTHSGHSPEAIGNQRPDPGAETAPKGEEHTGREDSKQGSEHREECGSPAPGRD